MMINMISEDHKLQVLNGFKLLINYLCKQHEILNSNAETKHINIFANCLGYIIYNNINRF